MSRLDIDFGRIKFIVALLTAMLLPAWSGAQDYPNRPIKFIVTSDPGGTSDFLARLLGAKLAESMGQAIVVENRPGAAGNIGTEAGIKAPPDGYTMVIVATTYALNPAVYKSLPFDAEKDFAAVTNILWQPYVMAVPPTLPVSNVKQLIALARARPGQLNYSSGGAGTTGQLAAELFRKMAGGINITHVPYRSLAPAITAVVTGEVQLTFASVVAAVPLVESGKLKGLAVTGAERIKSLPAIPTVTESAVPGYEDGNWQGIMVPARTPRPIINKLNQEFVRALKLPDINSQIVRLGANVIASTPEEFDATVRADLKKYADLVKTMGLRFD